MAEKKFVRQFASDFTGINAECSALEPEGNEVNKCTNLELGAGNSLRGRVGSQLAGNKSDFFGLFNYSYTRTQDEYTPVPQPPAGVHPNQTASITYTKTLADGATINKIVAIGDQMWMRDSMPITFGNVSATAPISWYTAAASGEIHLYINDSSATPLVLDFNCGDGITTSASIYDLILAVDATAKLSCAYATRGQVPPYALVRTAGVTANVGGNFLGNIYRIPVQNGHTFYPGDLITFSNPLVGGIVVAATYGAGTSTVDYLGKPMNLALNQVLGYLGQTTSDIEITSKSTSLIINVPYWRFIPDSKNNITTSPYGESFKQGNSTYKARSSTYTPPTAVNSAGCLYVASKSDYSLDLAFPARFISDSPLQKTDGRNVYNAGIIAPRLIVGISGAGALTGIYKYKCFFRRYDAQGNVVDGLVSDIGALTCAASTVVLQVNNNNPNIPLSPIGRYAYKAVANESPATSNIAFYVDDSTGLAPPLQVGDLLCFCDSTTAQLPGLTNAIIGGVVGTLHKTICLEYASQTPAIRVADSAGYQITNNAQISVGLTCVILRTTAGGNQYYKLCEVAIADMSVGESVFDNVTDANLISAEQYIEVPIGKEHNPPPSCSLVCAHQGGLVVAGDPSNPSTVSFSTADGVEYFPLASNSFEIPSSIGGAITAIASDTADRLAVFKEKAYYDVIGDLDGGTFQINIVNEGDYGVSSQASLARISGLLVGVCPSGFVGINNGSLSVQVFRKLSARLINQTWAFKYATAVNDYFSRSYHVSIPTTTALIETNLFSVDYSRETFKFLDKLYTANTAPSAGYAMLGDALYHLNAKNGAVYRRLERFNGNSPTGNDGISYNDHTDPIAYIFESQPINFGEPGLLKTPLRLRMWSIPNDYIVNGWVPFSCLVETGAWPDVSKVGAGYNGATSVIVPFLTDQDLFHDVKLIAPKCHFYIVRFTVNQANQSLFLTGYEIAFNANYQKEDFVK